MKDKQKIDRELYFEKGPYFIDDSMCRGSHGDISLFALIGVHKNPIHLGRVYNIFGEHQTRRNANLFRASWKMYWALENVRVHFELTLQDLDDGTIDGPARHIVEALLERVNAALNQAKGLDNE